MWFEKIKLWFKYLFRIMRYQQILKESSLLSDKLPQRKLCIALLNELSEEHFFSYKPTNGKSVRNDFLYPSIDLYSRKMKEFTRYIKEEKAIPPDWYTELITQQSVDQFLSSSDGYYVDVPKAITQFRQAGLQLCEALKESDTATYGIYEHNLRILTKLFVNLRHIAKDLINISLTN